MKRIDVSIIIVNYNTKKMTQDCIESIFKHTKDVSFELLLVDNDSTDGSVELLEQDTRINFIRSGGNIGFGRANNLGYQYARGKYIFLLNSDTLLLNNAIKFFYDKMETFPPDIACLGSILKDKNMNDIHSYGEFPTITQELISRTLLKKITKVQYLDHPKRKIREDFEVPYITGADLFIRREIIDKHGFFDESFFMYYEETDLQYRFHKQGYKSRIIDGPSIIHLCGGSRKKSQPTLKQRLMALRSSFIYLRKNSCIVPYILYRIFFAIYNIPSLFRSKFTITDRMNYYKELLK